MKGFDTKISNDDLVKSQENFLIPHHSLASYECVEGGENSTLCKIILTGFRVPDDP